METTIPLGQNGLIKNSFLNSKFFDPAYWFNKGSVFFHSVSKYTFTAQAKNIFDMILFFFTIFFLALISYCLIRLLEIRAKEKRHLQHELEEYAHRHAQKEAQNNEI